MDYFRFGQTDSSGNSTGFRLIQRRLNKASFQSNDVHSVTLNHVATRIVQNVCAIEIYKQKHKMMQFQIYEIVFVYTLYILNKR